MAFAPTGMAIFEDPETGKKGKIDARSLNWESEVTDEREMGPEVCHTATSEVTVGKETFEVTFEVYEYPAGDYETHNLHAGQLQNIQDLDYGLRNSP